MIKSVFIANRGEIAVRIIRAAKELQIQTVLGYSNSDKDSLAYRMADKKVCIGGAKSSESYLNVNNIITAAIASKCDAIHPGVGFLSENADFAQLVTSSGLIFIGPDAATIRLLGDKISSRNVAIASGVPITPGSTKEVESIEEAYIIANDIGYPVMLKATAGGGGRGIRIVHSKKEMSNAYKISKTEALNFFMNDAIHIEKYLDHPRHVEVQLFGDGKGKAFHLGERDCSVQRNHQKLIEESPSTVITSHMRLKMGEDAVRLCSHLHYKGAGTVEFLVQDGAYYFMEVNARVQVEHPVSEVINFVDIIKEQFIIASNEKMSINKSLTSIDSHAIECRINASTAGSITALTLPMGPWVRVDTHIFNGYTITPHYDALLAKIIVHTNERQESINVMIRALQEFHIEGVKTNKEEQLLILTSQQFRSGKFNTQLYEQLFPIQEKR
ncbi:MAG: ATP-grasp domain-containing protein [Spirochaetia bacterium]|nr:ATP-grasp domain-containing protein [Spirochaetia bacterium]